MPKIVTAIDDELIAARQRIAIKFLQGIIPDNRGRKLDDYFKFDEHTMETDHEWVQWAFPIHTVSLHNPNAGLLFYGTNQASKFKWHLPLGQTQNDLLVKYFNSIGVSQFGGVKYPNKFFTVVDSPYNHHVKRISRCLHHMMITKMPDYMVREWLHSLMTLVALNPDRFDPFTVAYWNSIVYDYSHIYAGATT